MQHIAIHDATAQKVFGLVPKTRNVGRYIDHPAIFGIIGGLYGGLFTPTDFRAFTFEHAAELYTSGNPDYFKGTAVEAAVAARQ